MKRMDTNRAEKKALKSKEKKEPFNLSISADIRARIISFCTKNSLNHNLLAEDLFLQYLEQTKLKE